MKYITGGVTAPKGFYASATAAHIKYEGRDDMAMIWSEAPCTAGGTFTSNVVKAAPVLWDRDLVYSGKPVRAIVANSGIANACTGEEGLALCRETAQAAAEALGGAETGNPAESILLGSTGVIGMQIPQDKITAGVKALAAQIGTLQNGAQQNAGSTSTVNVAGDGSQAGRMHFFPNAAAHTPEAGHRAAAAVMTTDSIRKECAVQCTLSDGTVITVGGQSKGSGMIHPNMCTMLCYVTTDAAVSHDALLAAARTVVQDTFNMISVDGDTSTNDTMLVLANGLAGNKPIDSVESADYKTFQGALYAVTGKLAKMMAGDGEGASRLIECRILHAINEREAKQLAKSVVCSSLTKAAIFGKDANWGRILCALGYSGVSFDPEHVDLYFAGNGLTEGRGEDKSAYLLPESDVLGPCTDNAGESGGGSPTAQTQDGVPAAGTARKMLLFTNGSAAPYSEEEASKLLGGRAVTILCDMHRGSADATAWGCDLTYDYVKINADYRS